MRINLFGCSITYFICSSLLQLSRFEIFRPVERQWRYVCFLAGPLKPPHLPLLVPIDNSFIRFHCSTLLSPSAGITFEFTVYQSFAPSSFFFGDEFNDGFFGLERCTEKLCFWDFGAGRLMVIHMGMGRPIITLAHIFFRRLKTIPA